MPAGAEVTEPEPEGVTVSVYSGRNVADTEVDAPASVSEHVVAVPAAVHAPPQLSKIQPGSAVAASDTGGAANDALQVVPHETPAGVEAIEPLPVLVTVTTPVPVPVVVTPWAPPLTVSRTVTTAACSPTAVGLKRTAMSQVRPTPSIRPSQPSVTAV